jgi:hypothetical protein
MINDILEKYPDTEFLMPTGFDEAVIGVSSKLRIVYSTSKCIDILKREMSTEDAIEYFYFNVEGSYLGDMTPIYLIDLDNN